MNRIFLREIVDYLRDGENKIQYELSLDDYITSMSSLMELSDHSICWIKNEKYLSDELIEDMKKLEGLVVVAPFKVDGVNSIITDYPKGVYFSILNHFFSKDFTHTISSNAEVLTNKIGENVHIGAGSYICADVIIGNNTIIHPNVTIICPCEIGNDCEIFPGVVIGSDGFGYYMENDIPHREKHFRGVIIGNNVDIGANTCIDRGLITDTIIQDNVKIDNLCHIGHNDIIERNCLLTAGSVIGGSTVVKKNAYLAPNSSVLNQIEVGSFSTVEMGAVVFRNVEDNLVVMGNPARGIRKKGDEK